MSTSEIMQNLHKMSVMMADYDQFWTKNNIVLPDLLAENAGAASSHHHRQINWNGPPRPDVTLMCPDDDDLKEETEYFVAQTLDSNKTFLRRGSVRGVKNGVKTTIEQLKLQSQWKKNYEEMDRGKVVVYITSLGVIRTTWEKCRRTIAILENHRCHYERRDLTLCCKYIDELKNRSGQIDVDLPKIYIDGQYFGGFEKLEQWSEVGELKNILEPYKRTAGKSLCSICYGFRFLPCTSCRGGKKSSVYCVNEEVTIQLRCAQCDSCGLIACSECADGYLDC